MAPKLFCTGVTGYIGGDALYLFNQEHPDWEITCLVRNSEKGAKVVKDYPKIRLVYGDLDSTDLIQEETSKSDIIYHFANCDHVASAKAIQAGLQQKSTTSYSTTSYWIHTSGSMILGTETVHKNALGDRLDKIFDDWENIEELTTRPDEAAHRNVDKIVLATGSDKIKTAIVCPCTIYGPGRGPDNQRSVQVYNATQKFLETKQGFQIGKGQNIWNEIHVRDLSKLYLLLGEAAVNGGSPATWNDEGYYLAENGEFVWGDVLKQAAEIAHKNGWLPESSLKSYTPEEAEKVQTGMSRMVGTNSRGTSIRGKKLLGWKPDQKSLIEELPGIVELEAKRSGLLKGHAAKVEID